MISHVYKHIFMHATILEGLLCLEVVIIIITLSDSMVYPPGWLTYVTMAPISSSLPLVAVEQLHSLH